MAAKPYYLMLSRYDSASEPGADRGLHAEMVVREVCPPSLPVGTQLRELVLLSFTTEAECAAALGYARVLRDKARSLDEWRGAVSRQIDQWASERRG